jgi:hypothetical protein
MISRRSPLGRCVVAQPKENIHLDTDVFAAAIRNLVREYRLVVPLVTGAA